MFTVCLELKQNLHCTKSNKLGNVGPHFPNYLENHS